MGIFTCDNLGVPLGVVDVLPCRECRAHGRANQQLWLSAAHLGPCLARISSSSRSQCLASVSFVVKSSANPGSTSRPKLGHILATAEARGGEYISLTMALIVFPRSRQYLLVLPPRLSMMLMISPFITLAASRFPRSYVFIRSSNGMSSDSTISMSIVASPATDSPMVGRYAACVVVDQLSGICGLNLLLCIGFR